MRATRFTSVVLAAFVLCILFTSPGQVSAATYYVSPSGSDSNSGSLSAPWQTVQHAFSNVSAGDTVYFRGGVYPTTCSGPCYSQTLEVSGTSGSPITFENYPGEVAIIQGDTKIGEYSGYTCVSASTCVEYVTFQGTTTVGSGPVLEGLGTGDASEDVVDLESSSNVKFDHVEIRDGDYHALFYEYNCYSVSLTHSYVHDNSGSGTDPQNVDNGIYFDATNEASGTGSLIANNVVENVIGQPIQLYAGSGSVEYVTVTENTIVNNGNHVALYGSNDSFVNNVVADNGTEADNSQVDVEGTSYAIDDNVAWCKSGLNCSSGFSNPNGLSLGTVIEQDPDIVDAPEAGYQSSEPSSDHHNYRLLCGSPAFATQDTGAGYVGSDDKDGASRSSTSALGAYVY